MKVEKYFDERIRKNLWSIDLTIAGQRIRRSGFSSRREAEEIIAALKLQARAIRYGLVHETPVITLEQLYTAREADEHVSAKTQALTILAEVMDVLSPTQSLTDLRRADIRKLIDHFRGRGLKPLTINYYMGLFSSALHDAAEYFPDLEDWNPPKIACFTQQPGRERVLTKNELSALFKEIKRSAAASADAALVEHVRDTLRLMLLLGARRKELRGLSLQSVNLDWQMVQFKKTKNNLNRVIPVTESVISILKGRKKPLLDDVTDTVFLYQCRLLSKRAGLFYGDNVDGGWVPHDLRHTAGTIIESAGIPYSAVAALLGHKRRDQTATYTHVTMENLRIGVLALEKWCREIDGFLYELCTPAHSIRSSESPPRRKPQ